MNSLLFDNFCLVLIGVKCLNTLIFSFSARSLLKKKTELFSGYRRIILVTLVFFKVPFLIMGARYPFWLCSDDESLFTAPSRKSFCSRLSRQPNTFTSARILLDISRAWSRIYRQTSRIVGKL